MSTLKAFTILIFVSALTAPAFAAESVNYDDPNLAFTSQYVGDQKPDASPARKTIAEGDVGQQAAIRFDGLPWASAPHATLSPMSSAH